MKLWMSGRIDHDIADDHFRTVLNSVEQTVNFAIKDKDYGASIESWDVIVVIYKEKTEDFFRYNARAKETDIEISIDYDAFKSSDVKTGKALFFDALVRSLERLKGDKKIKDFAFDKAIDDIRNIATMH